MKYLTKEGYNLLKAQLELANKHLKRIELYLKPGKGIWRLQKRYIDGLEFLLDKECIEDIKEYKEK